MNGYREQLTAAMAGLAKDPRVCFVGYGVRYGGQAAGTLKGIAPEQLIETPVAENLMVGLALGLALMGRVPVVFIERFDFILNGLDALVNHVDKVGGGSVSERGREGLWRGAWDQNISGGIFEAGIMVRVVRGNRLNPLFTGATHTQDFTEALQKMVGFPVQRTLPGEDIGAQWTRAYERCVRLKRSTVLVEYKDCY